MRFFHASDDLCGGSTARRAWTEVTPMQRQPLLATGTVGSTAVAAASSRMAVRSPAGAGPAKATA